MSTCRGHRWRARQPHDHVVREPVHRVVGAGRGQLSRRAGSPTAGTAQRSERPPVLRRCPAHRGGVCSLHMSWPFAVASRVPAAAGPHSSLVSRSVRSRHPAYQVDPTMTTSSSGMAAARLTADVDAEVFRVGADDLLGDGERPLLDAQRLRAGHVAADQRLPDQRVEQADHDGVPGQDRQHEEERAVADAGDQRADRVADREVRPTCRTGRGRTAATDSAPNTVMMLTATTALVSTMENRLSGLDSR